MRNESGELSEAEVALQVRSVAFRLLGSLLLDPRSIGWDAIRAPELTDAFVHVLGEPFAALWCLMQSTEAGETDAVIEEHDRLFRVPMPGWVSPYASVYAKTRANKKSRGLGFLMGEPAQAAAEWIRNLGMEIDRRAARGALPDHIGILFALHAEALMATSTSLEGDRVGYAEIGPKIMEWSRPVAENLEKTAKHPFWRACAGCCRKLIDAEVSRINGKGSQPNTDAAAS